MLYVEDELDGFNMNFELGLFANFFQSVHCVLMHVAVLFQKESSTYCLALGAQISIIITQASVMLTQLLDVD